MGTKYGTNGNDTLIATGTYGDSLYGYGGDDIFVVNVYGDLGIDRAVGGDGHDTVVINHEQGYFEIFFAVEGSHSLGMQAGSSLVYAREMERIDFSSGPDLVLNNHAAADVSDNVYRLYKAAFNRVPDKSGFLFQENAAKGGETMARLAQNFIASPEFRQKYGQNPSNDDFIKALYSNVLGRDPDASGMGYYQNQLASGTSRDTLLVNFAESPENVARTESMMKYGYWFFE